MPLITIFNEASIVMTVISLITFLGILYWVYGFKHAHDFDQVAHLPFDDEPTKAETGTRVMEMHDE